MRYHSIDINQLIGVTSGNASSPRLKHRLKHRLTATQTAKRPAEPGRRLRPCAARPPASGIAYQPFLGSKVGFWASKEMVCMCRSGVWVGWRLFQRL